MRAGNRQPGPHWACFAASRDARAARIWRPLAAVAVPGGRCKGPPVLLIRVAALERPWLLVVDDVQWADAGTLRLLLHLAPLLRTMPLLIVAALREGDLAAAPSSPLTAGLVRHASIVRLHGLAAGDVGHLVGHVTGALPAAGVSAALRSATGGNPLFVAELAHRLHREGRLDRVTPGEELPVPPGVRVVLGLKLHDLDDACRRALAVAAVAGCSASMSWRACLARTGWSCSGSWTRPFAPG